MFSVALQLILLVVLMLLGGLLSGCRNLPLTEPHLKLTQSCIVNQVYDGDTVACDLNGDGRIQKPVEKIRLLGINAPETRHGLEKRGQHNPQADQPYAKVASRWLQHQAENKRVWVETDVTPTDRYGRTLAFLYLTPTPADVTESLNAQLVQQGLATSLYLGQNRKHQTTMEALEADAHFAQRGVWGP